MQTITLITILWSGAAGSVIGFLVGAKWGWPAALKEYLGIKEGEKDEGVDDRTGKVWESRIFEAVIKENKKE